MNPERDDIARAYSVVAVRTICFGADNRAAEGRYIHLILDLRLAHRERATNSWDAPLPFRPDRGLAFDTQN
jgi:hypothetical protein